MSTDRTITLPKVYGVSRVFDNAQTVLVSLAAKPTDDQLRDIHDVLCGRATPAQTEAARELDEMLLRELSILQKIALAGEGGDIEAARGFNEIAQRLGYLARSIPDLSRLAGLACALPADTATDWFADLAPVDIDKAQAAALWKLALDANCALECDVDGKADKPGLHFDDRAELARFVDLASASPAACRFCSRNFRSDQ